MTTEMTTETNKAISRQIVEEVWNGGNLDLFMQIIYPEVGIHDPNNLQFDGGVEIAQQLLLTYRTAFPDLQFSVEQQVAEGELVVTRWSARGTHQGELLGIPPTGKSITLQGMTMEQYSDGRPRQSWISWDSLGLLQQLGLLPSTAQMA